MRFTKVASAVLRDDFHNSVHISFRGYARKDDGNKEVHQILFETEKIEHPEMFLVTEHQFDSKNWLIMSNQDAQALLDNLYGAGFRPSEQGTAGQLSATQAHLKDMRDLVFAYKAEVANYLYTIRLENQALLERKE